MERCGKTLTEKQATEISLSLREDAKASRTAMNEVLKKGQQKEVSMEVDELDARLAEAVAEGVRIGVGWSTSARLYTRSVDFSTILSGKQQISQEQPKEPEINSTNNKPEDTPATWGTEDESWYREV